MERLRYVESKAAAGVGAGLRRRWWERGLLKVGEGVNGGSGARSGAVAGGSGAAGMLQAWSAPLSSDAGLGT